MLSRMTPTNIRDSHKKYQNKNDYKHARTVFYPYFKDAEDFPSLWRSREDFQKIEIRVIVLNLCAACGSVAVLSQSLSRRISSALTDALARLCFNRTINGDQVDRTDATLTPHWRASRAGAFNQLPFKFHAAPNSLHQYPALSTRPIQLGAVRIYRRHLLHFRGDRVLPRNARNSFYPPCSLFTGRHRAPLIKPGTDARGNSTSF